MGRERVTRMKIDDDSIKQLSVWMREGGIDLLELTTSDVSLCLHRDAPGCSISRKSASLPSEATGRAPDTHAPVRAAARYELTAPSPGIYLDRHPLSVEPLVTAGSSIEAGQLVGFLQIRSLLLPLRSAEAGRIVSLPHGPGETLGYGTVVMCLLMEERS